MANLDELAAGGTTRYSSAGGEDSALVVGHQAVAYGFDGRNTDTSNAYFIMVFDAITLPANGTKPIICVGVPPASSGSNNDQGNFGWTSACSWGERFVKGIYIVGSSTDAVAGLTITANSKLFFHFQYASEDGMSSL